MKIAQNIEKMDICSDVTTEGQRRRRQRTRKDRATQPLDAGRLSLAIRSGEGVRGWVREAG